MNRNNKHGSVTATEEVTDIRFIQCCTAISIPKRDGHMRSATATFRASKSGERVHGVGRCDRIHYHHDKGVAMLFVHDCMPVIVPVSNIGYMIPFTPEDKNG